MHVVFLGKNSADVFNIVKKDMKTLEDTIIIIIENVNYNSYKWRLLCKHFKIVNILKDSCNNILKIRLCMYICYIHIMSYYIFACS